MNITLTIRNKAGETLSQQTGEGRVSLVYDQEYQEGDCLCLSCGENGRHIWVQLDESLRPVMGYYQGGEYGIPIPFGEKRASYCPTAFTGKPHLLSVREALPGEESNYRNLAENSCDFHGNSVLYPHAHANIETRGESVFAARNAIDGQWENHSHGIWPWSSWGINRNPEAELTIDFGRPVWVDQTALVLRADFPHDNWWKRVRITFSDGSQQILRLEKTDGPQTFDLPPRVVSWVKLDQLIPDETDPSPFPALSQWEVYGRDQGEEDS